MPTEPPELPGLEGSAVARAVSGLLLQEERPATTDLCIGPYGRRIRHADVRIRHLSNGALLTPSTMFAAAALPRGIDICEYTRECQHFAAHRLPDQPATGDPRALFREGSLSYVAQNTECHNQAERMRSVAPK